MVLVLVVVVVVVVAMAAAKVTTDGQGLPLGRSTVRSTVRSTAEPTSRLWWQQMGASRLTTAAWADR